MLEYMPYCYLIGWENLNIWYYGVEYGIKKNANPTNLWTNYFTSSFAVKKFRIENGEPNIISIRKTFTDVKTALIWEHKVLVRMGVKKDSRFLNQHDNIGFPLNINNCMDNEKIRNKMKNTKIRINLMKFFTLGQHKQIEPRNTKILKERIQKYIDLLKSEKKPFIYTIKFLENFLNECNSYIPKKYPSNRKKSKRGKTPAISKARKGFKWYYDPNTLKNIQCRDLEEVPSGYIEGMYKSIKPIPPHMYHSDNEWSDMMKKVRENESMEKQQTRLRKFHDTVKKRKSKKNN